MRISLKQLFRIVIQLVIMILFVWCLTTVDLHSWVLRWRFLHKRGIFAVWEVVVFVSIPANILCVSISIRAPQSTDRLFKICFKEDEAQSVVQRFFGQKQFKGTVPQIREVFLFQSISFGLKLPGVNFHVILGSNIYIWGKIFQGPHHERPVFSHTFPLIFWSFIKICHTPGGALRGEGWGPLTILPQNFVFGALFGSN